MWMLMLAVASAGPATVIVGVEDGPPAGIEALGGRVRVCFRSVPVCLVEGGDPARIAELPGVRYAEPDGLMHPADDSTIPVTAECPDPWGLIDLDVLPVWYRSSGVHAPVVAIADSGFRGTHVDLTGRIAGGWDYGDDDPVPEVSPLSGVPAHGTFIAGLVAAVEDDFGTTGVAPQGTLFLQKVADSDGALYFSYAIAAMDDLATNHPEVGVLNYSLSSSSAPQGFGEAVQALGAADIVVVAAAANCLTPDCPDADNDVFPQLPASYPFDHVVAVASIQPDGTLDPQSHHGATSVDLAAPGADACSLGVGSDTATLVASGTSYAAPMVAGVAALVREAWPRLTAAEVVEVLRRSCALHPDLTDRVACGGSVDAQAAWYTPVIRLDRPDPIAVDGELFWAPPFVSFASSSTGYVVLLHPDWLTVPEFGATPFVAGDVLALPDGPWTATGAGTLVVVGLPRDGEPSLPIRLVAEADGVGELTIFAVATGMQDRGLRIPDPAEAPGGAWTVAITGAAADPTLPRETGGASPQPAACGCASGGPGGLMFALAGLLVRRRRAP